MEFGRVYLVGTAVELRNGTLMGTGMPRIWRGREDALRWVSYAQEHGLEGADGRPIAVAIVEVTDDL